MAINFLDPETTVVTSPDARNSETLKGLNGIIPSSEELTGIELRLLPPFVKDNGTNPPPLFKDRASLYCMTIVVSDINNQLVGGIDIQGFPKIADREHLPVSKTIFYWQFREDAPVPPSQIHTMVTTIRSRRGLRKAGDILMDLKSDNEYNALLGYIGNLAAKTTPVGAVLDIVTQMTAIAGKFMGEVEDKPIGTVINSYTALRGDFDRRGTHTLVYTTRNIDYRIELTVKDGQSASSNGSDKSLDPALIDSRRVVELESLF